ncbi:MAG: zinc metallopeptidase [Mogibacterium sp.]|nr:zinc metallopeptidase [Mogibacterium sp.]MBR0341602.1 zinc metallopeptidase [Oscillospiraceae bacterium]
MYYYYDYSWFVLLPAIIFTMITQARINSAYRTYSQVPVSTGVTGAEAARAMMDANGLSGVAINILNGGNSLVNYYDPKTKSLNLSREVYSSRSVSSVCIACHEVGHAIQDASHYAPLALRNGIVPVVNLTQMVSWPMIFFGLLMSAASPYGSLLFLIGVGCFLFVIFFHLITLPVEFNASNRALANLRELRLVNEEDYIGSRAVLKAAAMTYVAALATAVASLLRVFVIAGNRRS